MVHLDVDFSLTPIFPQSWCRKAGSKNPGEGPTGPTKRVLSFVQNRS